MSDKVFTDSSVLRMLETELPFDINSISLRSFLDDLNMGAYIVDRERKILYWNYAAEEITGFNPERVIGTRCLDDVLCHTDRNGVSLCSTHLCPLYRTMNTGDSASLPYSVYVKGREGGKIPLNITTIPLRGPDGVIGGLEIFEPVKISSEDLERAMQIQKSLIPGNPPEYIELFYHPSSIIGGDLIHISENWVALVDVSGHGISSALVSAAIRAILSEILTANLDIRNLGDTLEVHYAKLGDLNLFFTGVFLKMVPGGVEIACFGHPAPILIRNRIEDGEILHVDSIDVDHDILIGWQKPHNNKYHFLPLNQGESILLYSDGIIEIETSKGPLGEQGLKDILKNTQNLTDVYVQARTLDELSEQRDDISMLKVLGRNLP